MEVLTSRVVVISMFLFTILCSEYMGIRLLHTFWLPRWDSAMQEAVGKNVNWECLGAIVYEIEWKDTNRVQVNMHCTEYFGL